MILSRIPNPLLEYKPRFYHFERDETFTVDVIDWVNKKVECENPILKRSKWFIFNFEDGNLITTPVDSGTWVVKVKVFDNLGREVKDKDLMLEINQAVVEIVAKSLKV